MIGGTYVFRERQQSGAVVHVESIGFPVIGKRADLVGSRST